MSKFIQIVEANSGQHGNTTVTLSVHEETKNILDMKVEFGFKFNPNVTEHIRSQLNKTEAIKLRERLVEAINVMEE